MSYTLISYLLISFLLIWFLLLRERPGRHRRNDARGRALLGRLRFARCNSRRRALRANRLVERQSGNDPLDLLGVERFARQQRVGHVEDCLPVLGKDRLGARVVVGHEALHFLVDLERRVLAVVLVLGNLTSEEDLLLLLSEGERSHGVAHTPFAHHAARQVSRPFEVVASAGRDAAD